MAVEVFMSSLWKKIKISKINSLAKWNYRACKDTYTYMKNQAFNVREIILNLFMSLILVIPIIMVVISLLIQET